jgi:hypothetical protein
MPERYKNRNYIIEGHSAMMTVYITGDKQL